MEEARGEGEEEQGGEGGGRTGEAGKKGGCGMWDGEDEANNDKKELHFNLEAFFLCVFRMRFLSLSPLASSALPPLLRSDCLLLLLCLRSI